MNFGKKLRIMRNEKKLTLTELANKSGVSFDSISKYENNQRIPSIEAVKKLSIGLQCDINSLIDEEDKIQNDFIQNILIKEFGKVDFSKLDYMQLKNFEYDFEFLLKFLTHKYKLKD